MHAWTEISFEELINAKALQTIVFQFIIPSEHEVKAFGNKLDLSKSDLNFCYSRPILDPWSGENKVGIKYG